ncbi:ATP-binding protein [Thiosocius teredinicola]|uniref:ATP-binding protein n=1 Tax=Thiosocius teredinicola TaxID=1973002 RepID=UPI000990A17E
MNAPTSLKRRLLVMLISGILLVWLAVLVLVYRAAQHEVEEVFDADMARSARILQSLLIHEVEEEQEMAEKVREVTAELNAIKGQSMPRLAAILQEYMEEEGRERLELVTAAQNAGQRYQAGLAFVARYGDGTVLVRDSTAPDMPQLDDGFANVELGDAAWRVFTLTQKETGFVVQVGEKQAFRAELVGYITSNTLMPALIALPILALLISWIVGRALKPLESVARDVARRAPDALDPIEARNAPQEVHTLVQALNDLFARVASTLRRERQFTADAAHELRTPLAALKTHLQVARKRSRETSTRQSLDQALQGVDRATHSVEQLLLLARADSQQAKALVDAKVDLGALVSDAVSVMSQQAVERDIDLGVDGSGSVNVVGDATALQVMLRNLVDNAVRYTPRGGTVTVSAGSNAGKAWLQVADDGPGVAAEERGKIFDRFHRGEAEQANDTTGSGLGLSIVQRIAQLHGATIELGEGLHGRGLAVRVVFAG